MKISISEFIPDCYNSECKNKDECLLFNKQSICDDTDCSHNPVCHSCDLTHKVRELADNILCFEKGYFWCNNYEKEV